jgi:putative transposase
MANTDFDNPERVVELGLCPMPQSLSRIYLHIIFSTKNRERALADGDLRKALHAYMGATMKPLDCMPVEIGGVDDHVHILCLFPRTRSVADVVKETKRVSTNWLQEQGSGLGNFHWQAGYGVFSVSQSGGERCDRIHPEAGGASS